LDEKAISAYPHADLTIDRTGDLLELQLIGSTGYAFVVSCDLIFSIMLRLSPKALHSQTRFLDHHWASYYETGNSRCTKQESEHTEDSEPNTETGDAINRSNKRNHAAAPN